MKLAFLERARVLAPLTHALVVVGGMWLQLRLHFIAVGGKMLAPRREHNLRVVPNLRRSTSSERAQTRARACTQHTCTPHMHSHALTHARAHTRAHARTRASGGRREGGLGFLFVLL